MYLFNEALISGLLANFTIAVLIILLGMLFVVQLIGQVTSLNNLWKILSNFCFFQLPSYGF